MTHDDLVAGICRQRGLNFSPGSRYLYSNSNFLLLGRVIEKASGQSLREFLDRRIFGPVGMSAPRHVESPAESVPGLATGYFAADSGWWRAQHGFPLHGEGGLVSCVEDLALWHRHLGSPRGAALAESLTARVDFTNGRPTAYARGVGLRRHRGVNQDLDPGRRAGRPGGWRHAPERSMVTSLDETITSTTAPARARRASLRCAVWRCGFAACFAVAVWRYWMAGRKKHTGPASMVCGVLPEHYGVTSTRYEVPCWNHGAMGRPKFRSTGSRR